MAVRLDARVSALHVNYGLREGAAEDEAFVRELCGRLDVPLHAERAALTDGGQPPGPARQVRYALAEQHAEAVLRGRPHGIRPGRDGALPARGVARLARPARYGGAARAPGAAAAGVTRDEVRDYLRMRGAEWREDPSNADRRFARVRVRQELIEAMRSVGPAPERTIAETARQLREEADVLDAAVAAAVEELGGGPAVALAALREYPPAVRRLVLRRLAGDRPVPDSLLEVGERGTKSIDLGGGPSGRGRVRDDSFHTRARGRRARAGRADRARQGQFRRLGGARPPRASRGEAEVRAEALAPTRSCAAGARATACAPLGLGGTKTLQDLFTDRKVPRELRRTLPVVEAHGEIVWVAGVAVGERFAAREGEESVGLSARRSSFTTA